MDVTTRAGAPVAQRRWYRRLGPSVLVLTVALFALGQLAAPDGYLSTDTGGKVATLEAMAERGDLSPDLGWWAESVDPDGSLYPMYSTTRVEEGWVNVTTLPMLYLALPLYELGGARFALLVPVLGAVAAAAVARAVARRLSTDGDDGTVAFWLVGLASPLTVYALDLWEHTLGAALMAGGVLLALEASTRRAGWAPALAAGAAFGLAATMRQEALVYGLVAGVALGVRLLAGGRVLTAASRGAAVAAGAATVLAANAALEVAVMGSSERAARSTATAGVGPTHELGLRVREAVITGASPFARDDVVSFAVAALVVGLLVVVARRADGPAEDLRIPAAGLGAVAALVVVDVVGGGLGFIPGLAVTTPLAVVGATRGWGTADRRFTTAVALAAVPLVWAFQYTGGAGPQWGGRYLLTTGLLLAALATVTLTTPTARRVLRALVIASAAVTALGVVWTVQRTHAFADATAELAARAEPVLVFHDPFLSREAGPRVLDERWLAATGPEARAEAVAALEALGITEVGFVDRADGAEIRDLPGWEMVGDERVGLIHDLELRVVTWRDPRP